MKGHDLSRYINLEIIKAYTNMVRKAIRLISKEMSTHREERNPRTGSGMSTSVEERENTLSSTALQESNLFPLA